LRFNEAKATQAAAHLLKMRGGRMKYIKLIKLLYLADRKALARWGRPITTDRYAAMEHGPVVSRVYALISSEPMPGIESEWRRYIATVDDWDVRLKSEPPNDELSQAEEEILTEVFNEHGHKNRWTIVDEMHRFPEWRDPQKSSTPISYVDIFRAVGKDEEETAELLAELKARAAAEALLQPA
jgi:uncharacterized phage-associated protein